MAPFLCAMLLAASEPATQPTATFVIDDWEKPNVQVFDPKDPPPTIKEWHEGADATANITWQDGGFSGDWDAKTATLTITGAASVQVSGRTYIRVPKDVAPALRHHEDGHDQLNGNEYRRSARLLLEQEMRDFVGSTYVGKGTTDQQRQDDAWAEARAGRRARVNKACLKLLDRMDELSRFYDEVTEHGNSRRIDTEKGIAAALRHRDLAATEPAATGTAPRAGPGTRPSEGTPGNDGPPTGR